MKLPTFSYALGPDLLVDQLEGNMCVFLAGIVFGATEFV